MPSPPDLVLWDEAERRFAARHYGGGLLPGAALALPVGSRAAPLFTAPHAVNHCRAGNTKLPDRGTGGLALALHAQAGTGALVAEHDGFGDANYDTRHPLKDLLAAIAPRAVIDLHGMAGRDRHPDVSIGTAHNARLGAPLASLAKKLLEAHSLVVGVDERFDASRPSTITSTAHELGIPAIQLEIAPGLRPPLWECTRARALFAALVSLASLAFVPPQPLP